MKRVIALALVMIVAASAALAGVFPEKATYLIYIHAVYAGKSVIKTTEKKDAVIFESTSEIEYEGYTQKITCRSEFGMMDHSIRSFAFKGTKNKEKFEANIHVRGDSVFGDFVTGDAEYSSGKHVGPNTFFLEGYVPEHHFILARYLTESEEAYQRFSAFYPSAYMSAFAMALLESEAEIATVPKPTVCTKYRISLQNGGTYFILVEPKSRLPIYMAWSSTLTEIFLVDAFGDNPTPIYLPDEKREE